MITTSATLRFLRMSPRKVRLVVDVVRGLSVAEALAQLKFSPKGAARPVRKLIESAVANAVHNDKLDKDALFISAMTVDQGPTYKRTRPRAFGRAAMIRKRTSHVHVVLAQRENLVEKKRVSKVAHTEPKKKVASPKTRKPVSSRVASTSKGSKPRAKRVASGEAKTPKRSSTKKKA